MKDIWTNFEGEYDDEDFGLSKDHDDAWTVRINGINESYWKNKIDAIETILETINSLANEVLTIDIDKVVSKISEIEEPIEDIHDLSDYLSQVDVETFHTIIKKLLKNLKIKSYNIKLINNDGEEREFEEL